MRVYQMKCSEMYGRSRFGVLGKPQAVKISGIFFSLILVLCFVPEISRTTVVDISEE